MSGDHVMALEVHRLRKEFPGFCLQDVSFELPAGYIMGFIGPNGAGKSTTIKLIMNLLRKDGGTVRLFGLDHVRHEKQCKNRIGFVYDENHYYEELSLREMTGIVARAYSDWDQQAYERYLKKFALDPRKKIKNLSKGMKMKYALAVALSHRPDLLLMDEPTSGLDPVVRSELLEILGEIILDEKKAVLFSTHITSDLERVADYVTLINAGKIVFSAAKDEILESYCLVKGSTELLTAEARRIFVGLRTSRFGFEGLVRDNKQARVTFGDSAVLERPSLEEILLYTVRGDSNA